MVISHHHFFVVISPRHELFTWEKDSPPARVLGLPRMARKRFNAFNKEAYEKLALPG